MPRAKPSAPPPAPRILFEPPPRPACFGQVGALSCACGNLPQAARMDCIASRYFWMDAQALASLDNDIQRQAFINWYGDRWGRHGDRLLREAAATIVA